ncbi:MAG: peptidylprolyl isomerase [Deltaproteobacteria bacterium]|nr:peptidylprolyl isomerase [Deltaproteobacteria bacterium]
MQTVESGKFVSVTYTGTLDDGQVFDSCGTSNPLEFQTGSGQLIQGFEDAVQGMALNEKKKFTIQPEDAYGLRDENHVHEFPRLELPDGVDPKVGETVTFSTPEGHQLPARLVKMDDANLTFDLNHPLAGETLTFEIEVVGISDTPSQTQACGAGCDCSSGCSC